MICELESTWKEAVVAHFKVLCRIRLEKARETTRNFGLIGALAEIRNGYLINSSQKLYGWSEHTRPYFVPPYHDCVISTGTPTFAERDLWFFLHRPDKFRNGVLDQATTTSLPHISKWLFTIIRRYVGCVTDSIVK